MLFPEASGCFFVLSKSEFRATKWIIITKFLKTYCLYLLFCWSTQRGFWGKKIYKSMFKVQASKRGILSFIIYQVNLDVVYTPAFISQGFWYFVRSRSREFQVNPRNPAKFTKTREIPRTALEILPNRCRHNIFESYLGCRSCLLAVNVLIYLETSSPQRVNDIPKLPGVLRLMLRKTGKQRCKNPGVPSADLGNWRGECDSLFYCVLALSSWKMLRFVKEYPFYVHLTYKDDDLFGNGLVHEW